MAEPPGIDSLAVASPVVAAVAALFLSGCAALAHAMSAPGGASVETLLCAGLLAFAAAEAVALILGVAGVLRCSLVKDARGLPEACLGIFAVCLFSLTVLLCVLSGAALPAQ